MWLFQLVLGVIYHGETLDESADNKRSDSVYYVYGDTSKNTPTGHGVLVTLRSSLSGNYGPSVSQQFFDNANGGYYTRVANSGVWGEWQSVTSFYKDYNSLSSLANAIVGLNRFAITNSETLTEAEFAAKGVDYDVPWGNTPYIVFARGIGVDEDYNDYDMKIFYRAPTVQAVSASLMSSPTGVRIAGMGVLTGQTQGRTYMITIMPLWSQV